MNDDNTSPTFTIPVFTFADRLRKARQHAGLSQKRLASEIGISPNTVQNYEGGKVQARKPVILAWAYRCGVPLEWLMSGTAPEPEYSD